MLFMASGFMEEQETWDESTSIPFSVWVVVLWNLSGSISFSVMTKHTR